MYPSLPVRIDTPEDILTVIANVVVIVGTVAVFLAVTADFSEFHGRDAVKKEKKSIVETGTMTVFFILFYLLVRFRVGHVAIETASLRIVMTVIGSALLALGCFVNVKGRFNLGKNWSNQIRIYTDHSFVSVGMYGFVRHPLYASLIWMFLGACLVYANPLALLATVAIFVPFMYYRAKQEERLLESEFPRYAEYRRNVGMFFPKSITKRYETV
jgi:protein-S-isoprenylcysteine O-methyltransferase Ste14